MMPWPLTLLPGTCFRWMVYLRSALAEASNASQHVEKRTSALWRVGTPRSNNYHRRREGALGVVGHPRKKVPLRAAPRLRRRRPMERNYQRGRRTASRTAWRSGGTLRWWRHSPSTPAPQHADLGGPARAAQRALKRCAQAGPFRSDRTSATSRTRSAMRTTPARAGSLATRGAAMSASGAAGATPPRLAPRWMVASRRRRRRRRRR